VGATSLGRSARSANKVTFGALALLALFLLVSVDPAGAAWTPPVTVTEGGAQYSFGQDLGPGSDGMVVWSARSPENGYAVFARTVGPAGELGTKLRISSPIAGSDLTTGYAPAVRYDSTGTATVVWLESSYEGEGCFTEGADEPSCEVDEYVKSRQVGADESLDAEQVIYHHHVTLTGEGQFGGGGGYTTYGQPSLVAGPSGTLTVAWAQNTFGNGCAAYGYTSFYADDECEAQETIQWARLTAAGALTGTVKTLYTEGTSGYGSGQPLLHFRLAAAANGTATVVFDARSDGGNSDCWGGESSIGYLRISPGGTTSAPQSLETGCGSTSPDLVVGSDGTAFAVWSWETNRTTGDDAVLTRISPGGVAEAPQSVLGSEGGGVSGVDVARQGSGAVAVWAIGGTVRSRALPASGALGSTTTLASPAAGHDLAAPRIAVATDGSALVAFEDGVVSGGGGEARALRALPLAANGTPGTARVLMAANRFDHGVRVAAGANGSFMAAWRVAVPEHNRIQAARLGPTAVGGSDDFADAEALDPELPSFAAGSNEGASEESGEPDHAGVAGGASVWFKWTPAASGPVRLSTCATGALDLVLAVYTGTELAHLTTVAAAAGGAAEPCTEGDASVRFDAVAGSTYRIAVDGQDGSEGGFGLKLLAAGAPPGNDDFVSASQVSGETFNRYDTNVDATKESGEPDHDGDPGGSSVWYSWTAPRTGVTSAWVCGNGLTGPLLGVYTGAAVGSLTAVGDLGGGHSSCPGGPAIRFQAVAGTTYKIAVDGAGGLQGSFQLGLAEQPANDDFAQAQALTYFPISRYESNIGASKQAGEPNHAGQSGGASVWYSWTPTGSGEAFLSACLYGGGEGHGALLAVYAGSDVDHLTAVGAAAAGASSFGCASGESKVAFDYVAGTTYKIAVDGEGGASGSFQLNLERVPANDDLAHAQALGSYLPQTYYGSNRHAGREGGEPEIAGDPGGASVWYSWTPSASGDGVVSACLSGVHALLGVYTGAGGSSFAGLTEVGSAVGNGSTSGCPDRSSEVPIHFVAGTTYIIAVDGQGGAEGSTTLSLEALPANDELSHAQVLSGPGQVLGSNRHATKQPGEPNHAGDPGGASVWYSWTPSQSGHGAASVCGYANGGTPLLDVYTGADVSHLTAVASAAGGGTGSCTWQTSEVEFEVEAGTTYYLAVDGKGGAEFSFELNLGFEATALNDDFADARALSGPGSYEGTNRDATEEPGEPEHAGKPGGGSVWFEWTPQTAGAYALLTCSFGDIDPLLAVYTGTSVGSLHEVASNDDGAHSRCSADDSEVRFQAVAGTTYKIAVDGKGGGRGHFELELASAPSNDAFAAAIALSPTLPDSEYGSTRFAVKEAGEPNHAGDPGGTSVWYSWTPTADGPVQISTCAYGALDPLLAVYTGTAVASLTPVAAAAADDGATGCPSEDAKVNVEAKAGVTYKIAVDGKGASEGWFELHLRRAPPLNDDFADAIGIPQEPTTVAGSTVDATTQPNDPYGSEGSVWYKLLATENGVVRLHTCSDDGAPQSVRAFTGSALTSLSQVPSLPSEHLSPCELGAQTSFYSDAPGIAFQATAGATYWIEVSRLHQFAPLFEVLPAGPFALIVDPPANDLFAGAEWIPAGGAHLVRSNVGATRQVGEEVFTGELGGASIWFRWFADATGPVTIDTCGSTIDTLLIATYGRVEAGGADDDSDECGSGSTASSVAFEAEEGKTYLILVDGKHGQTGMVDLNLDFDTPDTTPPETSVYIPPAINSSQLNLQALRDEPGSSFDCSLDAAPFSPCAPAGEEQQAAISFVGLAEGPHTLAVREVDLSGNVDPTPVSGKFIVDTTPPQTTIESGPEGPTRYPYFGFSSSEENSTFECAIDGGAYSYCSSYFTPGPLPDGEHEFKVRATDQAGNRDQSPATREFDLDTTPPVPTILGSPSGTVASPSVRFTFSADEPSTFWCILDGKGTACESPMDYEGLADGDHVFELEATDLAGNRSTTVTREFHVEAKPPETTILEGPPQYTSKSSVEFEFASSEIGSTFECSLDSGPFTACEAEHTVEGLAEGHHILRVRAVDGVGKLDPTPSEWTWNVDTVPPGTAIAAGPSGLTDRAGPFSFYSDEEEASFECGIDGEEFSYCSESREEFRGLEDGPHVLRVRAVDRAGNVDPTPVERSFTLDTTPPTLRILSTIPPLIGSDFTLEFEAEAGAFTECALDNGGFQPCGSPAHLEGMPDSPHTITVRAVDAAGNESRATTEEFTVDEQPPNTSVSAPEYTRGEPVEIGLGGSADARTFECALDGEPLAPCTSPVVLEGLAEGTHRFRVVATDSAGNVDPTPAEVEFTVDRTPPDTIITGGPTGPLHDEEPTFTYESTEPRYTFDCAFDDEPWHPCADNVGGIGVGEHVFKVRAYDQAGNVDPTPAEHPFRIIDQAPSASLTLDQSGGPAPLDVEGTVGGTDPDGDELQYEIQFGDGTDASGGLPDDPVAHTYTEPGVYVVRATVTDGYGPKSVVTRTVTVGPPEPLAADAGDDLVAIVGEPVTLDGSNSRPLRGIETYAWRFGDGGAASGKVVEHTYYEPGTYEAKLTTTRKGESASDTVSVHVVNPPPGEAVHVTVRGDGTPLPGAEVLAVLSDGSKVQALTGAGGVANLHGLPDGSYKVYAFDTGYLPATGDLTVSQGTGEGQIEMHVGQLATATAVSHRMTLAEIEAAGIDTSDPANQHSEQFNAHIVFTSELNLGGAHGGGQTISGIVTPGGFYEIAGCVRLGPNRCRTYGPGGEIAIIETTWVPGIDEPILSELVIPFKATFLKEFYEVSLIVQNLAEPGFDLTEGTASIDVPGGMSLAPTVKPQSAAVSVPDIPGGGSATVNWVLRGDEEGEYGITAHYGSILEPFGRSVTLEAKTAEPIKVWAGSALRLEADVDETARPLYPYTVYIKLTDVADVPVYNPAVELLKEGSVGYIEQPAQRRSFAVRELLPGQTHVFGPYIIVPQVSGTVDLERSLVKKTAGDVDLGGTIVTHRRQPTFAATPRVEATNLGGQIKLDWEPVPGAARYEVFRTTDPKTPFEEEPVEFTEEGSGGVIPAPADGEDAWYGVSSIVNGEHIMVHPMFEAPPPPPPGEEKEDGLGPPKGDCGLDKLQVGQVEILASCFVQKPGNVYEATGRVRVDGIDLFPLGSRVIVDLQQGRITIDRVRVQVGNIVLYSGKIDWSLKATIHLGIPGGTTVRGLPVSGDLSVELRPDGAELEASAKLPSVLGGVSGKLKLGANNEDGPALDHFELEASGLSLDGHLGIDAVLLKYKRTSAGDLWEGGAMLAIPRPGTTMKVQGRLGILNGKFHSAAVAVDGLNQYLAYGVFLQRLRASVAVDPLSLSGGIGLSAGPQVLGKQAISVDGDGTATFGNPQIYEVSGNLKVAEAQMASGHLSFRSNGLIEFGGELGLDKDGFKAEVSADGWVDGLKAFNAHGQGTFSVSEASFGAEGVVSSVGIAACRRGFGPDVGAGYRWGGHVTFFASSCDISDYEAVKTSKVARTSAVQTFRVTAGKPIEVLAFHGAGAAPRVVLREADGTEVVSPADGHGIDEPKLMLAESAADDTTYVAVYSPPGGEWTVGTAPGSAPITGVQSAGALPEPQAAATVEPGGSGEATLRWQVQPIPGQQVEFVEETAHGAQVIATTEGAGGTATFTPLTDDDASRRIVAIVDQYGLPRTEMAVNHYIAPPSAVVVEEPSAGPVELEAPSAGANEGAGGPSSSNARKHAKRARPAVPARVRLRRHGGTVVATWAAVPGAERYEVRGRISAGRPLRTTVAGRRVAIRGVPAGAGVTVKVRALGADGLRGAARAARLEAAR
jgi:hypothetical protein